MKPTVLGKSTFLPSSLRVGHNVLIHDNCSFGENSVIGNNVIIYSHVEVGKNCQIQDNVVIGKKSFATSNTGSSKKVTEANSAVTIGDDVLIGTGALLYWGCRIGNSCIIADMAIIREGVVLGYCVRIGKQTIIEYEAVIGDGTRIQAHTLIGEKMQIGRDVFIGPHVSSACDKNIGSRSRAAVAPPIIRDGAKIGEAVVLHPGIEVGKGAIVGAGSLVLSSIGERILVIGHPCRVVRRIKES